MVIEERVVSKRKCLVGILMLVFILQCYAVFVLLGYVPLPWGVLDRSSRGSGQVTSVSKISQNISDEQVPSSNVVSEF